MLAIGTGVSKPKETNHSTRKAVSSLHGYGYAAHLVTAGNHRSGPLRPGRPVEVRPVLK